MIAGFCDIKKDDIVKCGGKGASLIRLTEAGLPVPPGYILTEGSDASEVRAITGSLKGTYAVRSSALNEDGSEASFAGAYETLTDVKPEDIEQAVRYVQDSASSRRVEEYARSRDVEKEGIAVVIQEFVKPEFAGVVFTSDVITGSAARMTGNYVKGEGELLVSGNADAKEFFFDAMKYSYEGDEEFSPYAKKLFRYCAKIRDLWGMPMDIEWAVSGGKVYILQARPITTLRGGDEKTYCLNGSLRGELLLTKTNVGEIFMRPVSPLTYSIMGKVSNALGMPYFIDNIMGQAYLNVSVTCSAFMALGMSRKRASSAIKDIAGTLPEGTEIPVFPMSGRKMWGTLLHLLRPKKKKKDMGLSAVPKIRQMIASTDTAEGLYDLWNDVGIPFINTSLGEVVKGANLLPLFATRSSIEKVCGEELATRLLAGSLGVIDSMKPMLLLEDLAEGKITSEEYVNQCGHRHVNEMELMLPYPYEDPSFPQNALERHRESGINVHEMKKAQEQESQKARDEFAQSYPGKVRWLDKKISKFNKANAAREHVRSEGVRIFCVLREYYLKCGSVLGIGEDVFMLTFDEVLECLQGDREALGLIAARRSSYEKYLTYPSFPNVIIGRFDPDEWMNDPDRRSDIFIAGDDGSAGSSDDVKGFAGAAGRVTAKVRVISDINDAEQLEKGEVLVTTATNIGWTTIFPRAAAIITDIGAPLSHAAIVAREFGIPAVVGCGNATTVLKTGDVVTVDGSKGIVMVVEKA